MSSVLITGSAGFLGSHLAKYYVDQGYQVYAVDNYLTGTRANTNRLKEQFPDRFHFVEADVSLKESFSFDSKTIDAVRDNFKYIFHLASPASVPHYQKHSLETMSANSVGLKNALEFADRYKARLVFTSTSEVYGDPMISPQPENYFGHVNSFGPRSCYDEAKRFGEATIYSWNQRHHTQHGLVRIFNTYGPYMSLEDGRVVIQFMQQALSSLDLTVFGDGNQTRSFCYVDDLIKGLVLYAESDLCEPINLGNDKEFSILALAELILRLTGSKSKIIFKATLPEDPQQRKPDLTLAKTKLGFASVVSLEQGLIHMRDWLKK